MSHHKVEVSNLKHVYPDGTIALQDVSFLIHHGESVAIIGANGAGKSTLVQHLNGYLSATSGMIVIGDALLTRENLPEIRRVVGVVFHDADDQLFMPTVAEDVAFGPLNMGLATAEVESRVMEALQLVGAAALRNKPPYHLSAGEKKRVAIASVLSMLPHILVLDEPTHGLDPQGRRQLIMLLQAFHHTRIITSHDLDMVLELCQRTIVLHEGRVMADGPTLDIFRNEKLLNACRLEKPLAMQACPVCSQGTSVRESLTPLVPPHGHNAQDHKH